MDRIQLHNGVEMPQEGFGVFQVPESVCKEVVLNAIRAGYRLIDTASSYKNEEAVGSAIREAVLEGTVTREELFITTKAYIQEMGYDNLKEAFARSLSKLGLDYLDLYLVHMPLGDYYGAWRAMEELYKEGKIRAIGVCNFDAARLMDLCYNVDIRPMVNQIERHPHYQRHEELSVMHKLGVQPEGWAPFAEGMKGMFTEPVLREIAAELAAGNIAADPFWRDGEHNACRWCDYRAACHFEPEQGDSVRYRRKLEGKEFWSWLDRKEGGEEDGH